MTDPQPNQNIQPIPARINLDAYRQPDVEDAYQRAVAEAVDAERRQQLDEDRP